MPWSLTQVSPTTTTLHGVLRPSELPRAFLCFASLTNQGGYLKGRLYRQWPEQAMGF